VLLQYPPPGAGAIGAEIDVVMSTRRAPTCHTSQLALDYRGDGAGAGSDSATIVIRDTSSTSCLLQGPIEVKGVNAADRPVTDSLGYRVARALVLSPEAARLPATGAPAAGEVIGELQLSAEHRDGPYPPSYLCAEHHVVPAT